jgi:hypothetical protein
LVLKEMALLRVDALRIAYFGQFPAIPGWAVMYDDQAGQRVFAMCNSPLGTIENIGICVTYSIS